MTTPGPDLDTLAAWLESGPPSTSELTVEAVVTLSEHRDRRVIEPMIDLLASGRADEMVVRAAGWFADPGLHAALTRLADERDATPEAVAFWEQVDRAIARCHPDAAGEAEAIEVALLATTQASIVEVDMADVDVSLVGAYPTTEVVVRAGQTELRHSIWNFDALSPDDPTSLDRPFTLYRIGVLPGLG